MKISTLLTILACSALLPLPLAAEPAAVGFSYQGALAPTTTFQLTFAEPMVPPEKVGQPADPPPVQVRPSLKGSFLWTSQRSGTFRPEEPMQLSTNYIFTLRPGLVKADGAPLAALFQMNVNTPPLRLERSDVRDAWRRADASAEPKVALAFNADIAAERAAEFLKFVNRAGEEIPAVVQAANPAVPELRFPYGSDFAPATWRERSPGATPRPAGDLPGNHLWAWPAQPLPPGEDWELRLAAGLPAKEEHLRLLETARVKIGTVQPFIVTDTAATNALNGGRVLRVRFSKALAKEVTTANSERWFTVTPWPKDCRVEVSGNTVSFTGDFALEKNYAVQVAPGLPAEEPFVLGEPMTRIVRFAPVPARLYFEENATQQMAGGARQFHLLAVNVPRLRVTAKLFTPETLAAALEAYAGYTDQRPKARDEYFTKVDLDTLPGRTIWQQEIAGGTEQDVQSQIALGWDEILGAGKTGAVLLTAEQADPQVGAKTHPGAQALIQVTDLGVVWKRGRGETFAHVFSLATGRAVAGARLRLLGDKGEALAQAETDASGAARLASTKEGRWLAAEAGSDAHFVEYRSGAGDLALRRFHLRAWEDSDEEEATTASEQVFLFTERPVYRPGETIHLKGLARDWTAADSPISAGQKLTLQVTDARDRTLLKKVVTLSEFGSFSEDIVLPASGLGTVRCALLSPGEGPDRPTLAEHEVEVQEFQSNAFEIKLASGLAVRGDTPFEVPVAAQYYMGKALSKARLVWSLETTDDGFSPAGFESFDFCSAIDSYELNKLLDRLGSFSAEGKADLDASGKALIATTIPLNHKAPQPRSARLLCEITDLDQQTVSESSAFTVHSSDFYLGVQRARSLIHTGEPLPLEVVAVRTDGTPLPAPVPVTLRLTRIDWQTNVIQTAGHGSEYRHEPRLELVAQQTRETRLLHKDGTKWAVAPVAESKPLIAGKPGQYLLEAMSKDAAGREVVTATTFSVYGEGETAWNYENPFQIELTADREEYVSGQTARVLVKTPIAGEALVTVEREKVIRSFVTQLTGNAPVIEVPLAEGDAPNVFVSVMLLRGADDSAKKTKAPEYRAGYCELKVAQPSAKLSVYVQPSAPRYQPGEEVTLGGQVLDFQGRPVSGAEVTLYAVDEGVLSLMGYATPDPLAFFHAPRPLAVSTGLTLPTLLSEDPEDRHFGNKGYLVGGGGEGDALRKNFLACAFWNASLRTDAEGRMAAKFPAPDGLTRYRVIAVVQTKQDQFGSGESAFEINKPIMLEPALPKFANVGDQLTLRAVLHNTTEDDGTVEVAVALDSTAVSDQPAQRVPLPAHGSVAVDFPVTFKTNGEAKWAWTARFTTAAGVLLRDSVQTKLPVGFPVPLLRELRLGHTDAAQSELLGQINPELLEGTGTVRVTLTNSRFLELRESVEQLLHYPYGCVEQTTSSTLPWIGLRGLREVLPALQKTDAEIAANVARGVDRLLSMQTSSGGLAYWPGEPQPLFWGSAYGGFGLVQARRAGFPVPEAELARLCKYLSEELRGLGSESFDPHHGGGGTSDRCLALYTLALAGKTEPAYHELLFKKRASLGVEDRAVLALAILESGGPRAMVGELLNAPTAEAARAHDAFWSDSRQTAMHLLAWSQFQPESAAVGRLVAELFGSRSHGQWGTTQSNCWALLALSDYLSRVPPSDQAVSGVVKWDGKSGDFALSDGAPVQTLSFPLDRESSAKPLQLLNPGRKQVFTEIEIESHPTRLQRAAEDQGYAIARQYAKVADDGTLGDLGELRVGDRVLVTLHLEVRQGARYLAVDDPLPAIFEAVNPAFKSQETRAGEHLGGAWPGSYSELRTDRALFFANEIEPGKYTLRYLARVRAAGSATAPSAKIEEMYHPERFGLSETLRLTSLPLK